MVQSTAGDGYMKYTRRSEGYQAGVHTNKERQWFCALADRVGFNQALDYAEHIITFATGKPEDSVLRTWYLLYEDEKVEVDPKIRLRVENKVDRYHKIEHMSLLRRAQKAGHKVLDEVSDTGDLKQPVLIKYILDGVNQGHMLHNAKPSQEAMQMAGLTINIGNRPPPRKLRPKQAAQLAEGTVEGEFRVVEANIGSPA